MENDFLKTKYKLKKHPVFGYKYIDPLPSKKEITLFYEKAYYQHIQITGRGGHDAKLISSTKGKKDIRRRELSWLRKTYFIDKLNNLNKLSPPDCRQILDIGCGSGEFLEFMRKSNWKEVGIEPSKEAFRDAKRKGILVYNMSLEEFIILKKIKNKFNAVTLNNVLEHVLRPEKIIESLKKILAPGGIICIQVPNDFNKLQISASRKVNKKQWWVAVPDHLNYFDFQTLENLLKFYGFEILLKTTDFPMELFLLMGENYVDNPDIGKLCHQKRVNFELSIPKELRRNLYKKLAELGLGRECIIYARKK